MRCSNCQAELQANDRFCPRCGMTVRQNVVKKEPDSPKQSPKPEHYYINENSSRQLYTLSNIAIVTVIVLSTAAAIALIALFNNLNSLGLGLLAGFTVFAVGLIAAFLLGGLIRALGEILQNTAETAGALRYLCKKNGGVPVDPEEEEDEEDAEEAEKPGSTDGVRGIADNEGKCAYFSGLSSRSIVCPFCDTKQAYGRTSCLRCQAQFLYEL